MDLKIGKTDSGYGHALAVMLLMLLTGASLPAAPFGAKVFATESSTRMIVDRTGRPVRIPDYPRRIDGLSNTQSRFSTAYWLVKAAGGEMLTHDDATYFVTVTTEELIAWDPEIIAVGTQPSADVFTGDPRFGSLAAVRDKKVFISPEGQFHWSHFSSESFLCILFLAKCFHPGRFADIDLMQELKSYYAAFYDYRLTDDEARRILNHLPPAP